MSLPSLLLKDSPSSLSYWLIVAVATFVTVWSLVSLLMFLFILSKARQLFQIIKTSDEILHSKDDEVTDVSIDIIQYSLNQVVYNIIDDDLSDVEAKFLTRIMLIGILMIRHFFLDDEKNKSSNPQVLSLDNVLNINTGESKTCVESDDEDDDDTEEETSSCGDDDDEKTNCYEDVETSSYEDNEDETSKTTKTNEVETNQLDDDTEEDGGDITASSSGIQLMELDAYNVLPQILKFLPYEDLNSIACCNNCLKDLRADPSLDQTRSGLLIFRDDYIGYSDEDCTLFSSSLQRLHYAVTRLNLADVFQGNRTCLRLEGFVQNLDDTYKRRMYNQIQGVTDLLLVNERKPDNPHIHPGILISWELSKILPNITHLDCSFAQDAFLPPQYLVRFEKLKCWTCRGPGIQTSGCDMRDATTVRSFYLDGSPAIESYNKKQFIYGFPPKMERLDIGNVKGYDEKDVLSLLKHYKHLQWLRCDISNEKRNQYATLRPDVKIINW